jgi:hypothetical protein
MKHRSWPGRAGARTVRALALACVLAACGGRGRAPVTAVTAAAPRVPSAADRALPLLPPGAQLVIELDLARLRANPVVGALVARLAIPGAPPGEALADYLIVAAYGLGTAEQATLTLVISARDVPDATRLVDGTWVLGPADWVAQVEARAALVAAGKPLAAPPALLALRDRAVPPGAPGAALRITAELPFDARVALARLTGLEQAPARLGLWADVVDDAALVLDAEAEPTAKRTARPADPLAASLRRGLATVAADPAIRALGLPSTLSGAKLVTNGTWVRVILAVGPNHLKRVVERALHQLPPETPPP